VVRAYVAERKPQVRADAGRGPAEVFLRQSHHPGDEAEVDFGEVVVRLSGEDVRCFLFCLRLSFSGKALHRVSLSGGQEAFFEGHEHAFRVQRGLPPGRIRYDNLKAAVAQVTGLGGCGSRSTGGQRSAPTGETIDNTDQAEAHEPSDALDESQQASGITAAGAVSTPASSFSTCST
jgi:hypothetical protein